MFAYSLFTYAHTHTYMHIYICMLHRNTCKICGKKKRYEVTTVTNHILKLQDNILKIRRVYDAFLAEFPLCYGYWKKYADHEARLGSIEKVVEVYERAVQGVTYSVDIWLHYCIFSISTYGDPDTIRR